LSAVKKEDRSRNAKETMLSWIANNWDKFSIWVTDQPTFVEVAFGIGLFYIALQIVIKFFKLLGFLFSPLLASPMRFKIQKKLRPGPRKPKKAPPDDDSPPFVFR
jgi:hypothetical protein